MLSDAELERYARHIVLRDIGGPGQAALRRARVRPGRQSMTLNPARGVLFAAVLFGLSAVSCAHGLGGEAISFRVECNVPDATLWVDDVLVGKVTDWKGDGKQIRAGFHRIEVRHPNYYSFFQEVELPPGSRTVVNAKLRELLD